MIQLLCHDPLVARHPLRRATRFLRCFAALAVAALVVRPAVGQVVITTGTSGTIASGITWRLDDPGGTLTGNTVDNGVLQFNRTTTGTNTITVSAEISGTGSVSVIGNGTILLTGSNSWTGGTTLTAGELALGNVNALGSSASASAGTISFNGGALQYSLSGTWAGPDLSGRFNTADGQQIKIDTIAQGTVVNYATGISGATTSFTKLGGGVVALTGSNTYGGGTTVSGGTLRGNSQAIQGAIVNNGVVTFLQNVTGTYAGNMSGNGILQKNSGQSLTVSGSNSYTGGTNLNAGTLVVGSLYALGSTGTIAFAGGTLQYSASNTTDYSGRFSSAAGQAYSVNTGGQSVVFATALTSSGTASTFTKLGSGTLTFAADNTYGGLTTVSAGTLQIGNAGTTGAVPGDLSIASGAAVAFNRSNDVTYAGTISGAGSLTKLLSNTLTLTGPNSYAGGTTVSAGTLVGNTTSLQGAITNNAAVTFDQATSGTYAGAMTGTGALSKINAGVLTLSGNNGYSGGTTVSAGTLVGTTSSLQGAITNNAAVTFDQATSGTYAGNMTGTGSLTKTGAGLVTLSGSNGFSGATTLSAGTLSLGSANALLSTGTISFTGGTLQYTASNTADNSAKFSNAAGQAYAIDTNGQNVTLATALTSSGGTLTKVGTGILTLSGANSYSGGTTVSAGTLRGSTTSLQGPITDNATVDLRQNTNGTFAGAIGGTGVVTKNGSGTVTLTGSNTYSGGTTVSAGVLSIGGGGTTGSISDTGTLTVNAGLIFNRSDALTYGGAIVGTGTVTKTGAGTLTFTGSNTYSGLTTVSTGTLALGAGGTTGSVAGDVAVASGAALAFNRSDAVTYGGVVSGGGGLVKNGANTLTLTGTNTFTGVTTVATGTLAIGAGGTTGSIAGNAAVSSGAVLAFNRSNNLAYSGTVSGAGGLTQGGTGTLTLTGSSSYSGPTVVERGTLEVGAANAIPAGSAITLGSAGDRGVLLVNGAMSTSSLTFTGLGGELSAASSGTVTLAPTGSATISVLSGTANYFHPAAVIAGPTTVDVASGAFFSFHNNLAGSGTLTKTGAGTLDFTGSNAQLNSNLTINGGVVQVGAGVTQLGSGTATVNNGSTLDLGGHVLTNTIVVNSGSVINPHTGATVDINGVTTISGTASAASVYNVNTGGIATFADPLGTAATSVDVNVKGGGTANFSGTVSSLVDVTTLASGTATFDAAVTGNVYSAGAATFNNAAFAGFGQIQSGGRGTFNAGTSPAATVEVLSGGTGAFSGTAAGTITNSGSATFASGSTVSGTLTTATGGTSVLDGASLTGAADVHGTLRFVVSSGTSTVTGSIDGSDGTLQKQGAGTLVLAGASGFTGQASIAAGTLVGTTSTITASTIANAGVLRFDQATNGTYAGSISGTGSLEKTGSGTVVLAGVNAFSGPTTVQAGTLSLSGTLSASAVTVQSGAALTGSGFIGSDLVVSGTLSPGNSPGRIEASTVTLLSGATTRMDIVGLSSAAGTAGTDYDTVVIDTPSGLLYGGNLQIVFSNSNPFADGTTFDLFQFSGTPSGLFAGMTTTGSGDYAGLTLTHNLADGNWYSGDIAATHQYLKFEPLSGNLVIVPEPSTLLMAGGLGVAVLPLLRRRRKA